MGPVIETGKNYTLVIEKSWLDADGAPLQEAYRREFQDGDPDYEPPDPNNWTIAEPAAGTTQPLVVSFPEPLDHALLHRLIQVKGPEGALLNGAVKVGASKREGRFLPSAAWKFGRHEILAGAALEDLAGNRIGRPGRHRWRSLT